MAANTNPLFTITPVIGIQTISTANTARDGSGTIATLLTGGTYGTRVSRIVIWSTATNANNVIRLFLKPGGGSFTLWKEILAPATTGSVTVLEFTSTVELLGERALILPSGYILGVSTHVAEPYTVTAEGGDY
jgi:hypothetical protein